MQLDRNDATKFPCTDSGDIASEFENERRPHLQKSLKARTQNLKDKRKTDKGKRNVRLSAKASRNMTKARMRPDFKEWAAAHDSELHRHDADLRTWVYEDPLPSDKPVPFTMTYKAKKPVRWNRETQSRMCH